MHCSSILHFPNSKVLFIAEAPGRLGADKTGIPLHGDKTGDNFEALLGIIGWKREVRIYLYEHTGNLNIYF